MIPIKILLRLFIIAAIIYIVSPIDFFPELILGPIGYIDDVFVGLIALGVFSKTGL